jgi:hypothetical protein
MTSLLLGRWAQLHGYNQVMARPVLIILLVLGVIVAAAVVVGSVLVVRTVEDTVRPVADLSAGVSTQVAGILRPTPTILPDPVTIVREVRSLARLETIQYTVEKVITAETGQGRWGSSSATSCCSSPTALSSPGSISTS